MSFVDYFATIKFLEGLSNIPKQKDYMRDRRAPAVYLKRMRYFFELIGITEQAKFKFIHVAGTSGKGSVTAMLHEVLHSAGRRVGSFTSPFTTTSIEKIRMGGKYISPQEVVEIVDELKPHITRAYMESPYGGPSYFEIWFAIAIQYFLRKKCEWVVLEVGLGGKYDPGVLLPPHQNAPGVSPWCGGLPGCVTTVLTNVDYDHTHLLGRTLTKIAREKAGIMRRGVPFFTAEHRPHLLRMFEKMAKQKGAKAIFITPPTPSYLKRGDALMHLGMDYQGRNAALVKAVAECLKLSEQAIEKGIARAHLPCRFEIMPNIRRPNLRSDGDWISPMVVLDGAHSVAKMKATVANLERVKFKKFHLVLAITANKDVEGICKVIVPRADRVYVTRFDMPLRKCAHPRDLARAVKKYAGGAARAEIFMDCRDGLSAAIGNASPHDLVLVTGSFFLAGQLRKRWYSEEGILKTRKSF